jgi:hypothetical protein
MNLAKQFLESKGAPYILNGQRIVQMDTIPLAKGILRIEFLGPKDSDVGLAFKVKVGWIQLPGGRKAPFVHLWNCQERGEIAELVVHCPRGEVRLWNIYRIRHKSGLLTEDAWTGNSGMIKKNIGENCCEYACSSGPGPFDPSNLIVRVH